MTVPGPQATAIYWVLVDRAPDAFGVAFPDLPGCCAMAGTVDEALARASRIAAE